jgi:putative transposase
VAAQCQLAGIARSTVYGDKAVVVDADELILLGLLDEEYTRHPSPKAPTVGLRQPENGGLATHSGTLREPQACAAADTHRAQVRILGLVAMAPSPNTSKKHPQNIVILIYSEA